MILFVRMEINERKHELINKIAIIEVNSSIKLVSDLLVICIEVITNRQNPNKFAEVLNMC